MNPFSVGIAQGIAGIDVFFGTDKLTDEQRWDFIEDYFTGMGVDDLKKKFVSL